MTDQTGLGPELLARAVGQLGAGMHADSAAWFPVVHDRGHDAILNHFVLGVGGEAGEVLDVWKKADICGLVSTCAQHADGKHDQGALADEMADVFTYLLALAHEAGVDLVAAYLAKRQGNTLRWGVPGEPSGGYTWATVPVPHDVPGSGRLVERQSHLGGFHVRFETRHGSSARYVREEDPVPIALVDGTLRYAPGVRGPR